MTTGDPVRLATWNVHSFRGEDRRRDVDRVLAAVDRLGADLVALQEVDARARSGSDRHPLERAAELLEVQAVAGPTLGRPGWDYGNAVLSRREVAAVRRYDLSVSTPAFEPRGAVEVRVAGAAGEIRFVAIHLGLKQRERRLQALRLVELLGESPDDPAPVVVAGDLNAWRPGSPEARILTRAVGPSPRPRTFPSRRPLLSLDRIFVSRKLRVSAWGVVRDPATRRLSDHLPLWVDVEPA